MSPSLILSAVQQSALLGGLQTMCRLFWGPDLQCCIDMQRGRCFNSFRELETALDAETGNLLYTLEQFFQEFSAVNSLFETLEEEYIRLFISGKGGIVAPLYHSCYVSDDALMMGEPAIMMKRKYASRGLDLAADLHEPPDHISIELEYLYFLLKKGWADNMPVLIAEASSFASDTLLSWVNDLRRKLMDDAPGSRFYPCLAALLICVLQLVGRL